MMIVQPLKVVLDTNIIISSLWGGNPGRIIKYWEKGKILLIVSQPILDEYFEVLNRFNLNEDEIEDTTILFSNPNRTLIVSPKLKIHLIHKDPADNKFLECAFEGKAAYIISGDTHLLELQSYKNIKIVSARDFVNSASLRLI